MAFLIICLSKNFLSAQITTTDHVCAGELSTYLFESTENTVVHWRLNRNSGIIINDGVDERKTFEELTVFNGSVYVSEIQVRWSNNPGTGKLMISEKIDLQANLKLTIDATRHLPPQINNIFVTDITCNGSDDGSITIAAVGDGSVLQYSLNGGEYTYSNTFSNLSGGVYTVDVRYEIAKNCIASQSGIVVAEPAQLNATVSSVNVTCNGDSDGSITFNDPSGGWGNYEHNINGGTDWSTDGNFTNLSVGSYDLLIRDQDFPGCIESLGIVNLPGDMEAPTVVCPANREVCADNEISQEAIVTGIGLTAADYNDNCTLDANLTVMYKMEKDAALLVGYGDDPDGDPGGYSFTEGTSVVTYKVIDENSNEQTCSFDITVKHKPNSSNINY